MPADTDGSWRTATAVPFKPGKLTDKRGKNPIDDNRGLFVIHAIHLRTGKVLWFCGHAETLDYPLVAFLFDPRKPNAAAVPKPFPGKADLFCCHYVQLADGRILVVGGSQLDHVPPAGTLYNPAADYRGSQGASTIAIFDPRKEVWEPVDSTRKLAQGRWYPTAVVLGDGSVLVVSGRRERVENSWTIPQAVEWVTNRGIAQKVEHLSAPTYKPLTVTGADKMIPIYPGIHLAPDDRLYTTHTTWGQEIDEPNTLSLTIVPPPAGSKAGTPATGTWTEYVLPTAKAKQPEREEGMSVMLPVMLDPATKQRNKDTEGRYLVVGGGFAVDSTDVSLVRAAIRDTTPPGFTVLTPQGKGTLAFHHQKIATPTPAEILDTRLPGAPRWLPADGASTPATQLKKPRINGHCVLLPDATVLVLGGHDAYKWNAKAGTTDADAKGVPKTNPTLEVEIYTPGTGFRVGAPMTHPRMYHSIAMLLVDGSVIVAGGADANEHEPSLKFPMTWEGRLYPGTARRVEDGSAGDMTLQLDGTPGPYSFGFADMPVGTRVIIDPGPNQIVTTLTGFNTVPGVSNVLQILEIADALPRDIAFGTKVDFEPATAGTGIRRRNEWLSVVAGAIDRHEAFSTPLNRKDFEIYQPPYFHLAGTRPVLPPLKAGEVQVKYGATFTIRTPDAARITRVAIMRPACVTHHTDTEQRFVELPFQASTDTLQIDMVPGTDSSLVPPGYYMLWILAGALPCVEARFIQLVGAPALRSPTVPTEVAPPAPPPPPPPPAEPPLESGGICPLSLLATTVVALAQITQLRRLRTELCATPAGHRFVRGVARPYYGVGTPLARWLANHARWRAALRAVVLAPLARAVALAERLSRRRADQALRRGRLIALLSLVGLAGVALAPLAALASGLHVAVHGDGHDG